MQGVQVIIKPGYAREVIYATLHSTAFNLLENGCYDNQNGRNIDGIVLNLNSNIMNMHAHLRKNDCLSLLYKKYEMKKKLPTARKRRKEIIIIKVKLCVELCLE